MAEVGTCKNTLSTCQSNWAVAVVQALSRSPFLERELFNRELTTEHASLPVSHRVKYTHSFSMTLEYSISRSDRRLIANAYVDQSLAGSGPLQATFTDPRSSSTTLNYLFTFSL